LNKSPIEMGDGYQNKVLGNTITTADGSPVMADTPVTATATIPTPTYTVTIPEKVDLGSVNGALEKYRNEVFDRAGKNINVSQEFIVSATGVANLFDKKTLSVSIGTLGTKTTITGGGNAINCSILIGTTHYTEGNEFAEFVNDIELSGAENKRTGSVYINRCDITKTANYTGTMTFNITIKEAI
ncbi:MAG: hypothetical protein RR263_05930, partial [Oscillospiraceae bacterium]